MNNKILLLAVNLKSLLAKEDMNVDSIRLINEMPYAISVLRKALTSENLKTIETARSLIAELGINAGDVGGGSNASNGSATPGAETKNTTLKPQTEAERIQAMKDKYKKDNGRS